MTINSNQQKKLEAYESILLYKKHKKKLMKNEKQIYGNIVFPLFKLLDKYFFGQSNRGFFNHWNFFQVSIESLYSGLKMFALQSKYITEQ
jgi:hypothetical protein